MSAGWLRILLSVAFVALLAAALTAVNLDFTRSSAGGTDFLARWLGTRLYLTERQNPYSPETTLAIQEGFYGRPARENEDQAYFAYPFYSMLVFAPFSLVADYPLARALWITAQETALVGTAFAAIALSGWRPGRWALAAFLFFTLTWLHGAKPLVDGNASILVGLLATLGLLALRRGHDGWAGIAFALSTFKPHIVALLIVFVLLWILTQKRRGVLWSFVASMLALCGLSFALQPSWLLENLAQMLAYGSYTPPGTLAGVLAQTGEAGRWAGLAISAGLGLLLLYEWAGAQGNDFEWFLWTACVTIVIGPLVGVASTSSNYAIFLPVLAWLFALWQRRTSRQRAAWFIMAVLFAGVWALFLLSLQTELQFDEHPIVMFVAPIFLLINLYWLRWWLLKPRAGRGLRGAG